MRHRLTQPRAHFVAQRARGELRVPTRTRVCGLWADGIDRTRVLTRLGGPTHLALHAIWPKLYRRLHEFMRLEKALGKLDDWMAVDPASRNDEVIVGRSTHTRLHDVIEVARDSVRMRVDPLDIVVKSGAAIVGGAA